MKNERLPDCVVVQFFLFSPFRNLLPFCAPSKMQISIEYHMRWFLHEHVYIRVYVCVPMSVCAFMCAMSDLRVYHEGTNEAGLTNFW